MCESPFMGLFCLTQSLIVTIKLRLVSDHFKGCFMIIFTTCFPELTSVSLTR
jgi:hypothetical protein